ncbi:MAG: phosphatase [Flavobacteriales bacterium]|nr:phosphatase [Flavobacteriales bacterium]
MLVAIIDIGTNTFNLLVCQSQNELHVIHGEEVSVFLGRGGIERGILTDDAMERGIIALRSLVEKAHELGVERIDAFGTSALRNARNAHVFAGRVKNEFDFDIRIITGDEEASLILDGVRQAVTFTAKPMLVMDIGGGSIEFILATNKALMWKRSFEIGATRLLERFSPSDPITLEEHFRIASYLDAQLEPLFAMMDRHWPHALVGSAGSFDTIAEMMSSEKGTTLADTAITCSFTNTEFDAVKERLLAMDRSERQGIPGLPEFRVDTIPVALIAIERVLLHGIEQLHWSRYSLKEGAAMRAMSEAV